MSKFQVNTLIYRQVEDVFAFTVKLENRKRWQSSLYKIEKRSNDPIGQGTTWIETSKIVGQHITTELTVTAFEPNRRFQEVVKAFNMNTIVDLFFEKQGENTMLITRVDVDWKGIWKLGSPLFTVIMKKGISSDLNTLKGVIEKSSC